MKCVVLLLAVTCAGCATQRPLTPEMAQAVTRSTAAVMAMVENSPGRPISDLCTCYHAVHSAWPKSIEELKAFAAAHPQSLAQPRWETYKSIALRPTWTGKLEIQCVCTRNGLVRKSKTMIRKPSQRTANKILELIGTNAPKAQD